MPLKIVGPAMVTSPTGKGVILMGGKTAPEEYSKAMFELSASMQWTRLEQTLQIEHYHPLAIPMTDELVKIVKSKKKSTKNDRKITQDNIKEWAKKKTVAKNMRKVDLVTYLESHWNKSYYCYESKKRQSCSRSVQYKLEYGILDNVIKLKNGIQMRVTGNFTT